jgi:hypothetical protein
MVSFGMGRHPRACTKAEVAAWSIKALAQWLLSE